jgi:hypothetical protein
MKSLDNFKKQPNVVLEEEKSDYSKFDILVRSGLANKTQLQRLHKILDKMKQEKPVFNPMERELLQDLFNKMVDIVTSNKQIFQQTRRVVREEQEIDEGVVATSDYKIGPSGRKVRAHRIVMTQNAPAVADDDESDKLKEELEIIEEEMKGDPPFVLVLKRKAIRLYPNKTKIALYYNDKIKKYFTIPYSSDKNIDAPLQSQNEEFDQLEESVMNRLHSIVKDKQSKSVKFANGQTRKVDHYTASAITQVHSALNDENKQKLADMVYKSPTHFMKAADFALSKVK